MFCILFGFFAILKEEQRSLAIGHPVSCCVQVDFQKWHQSNLTNRGKRLTVAGPRACSTKSTPNLVRNTNGTQNCQQEDSAENLRLGNLD